MFRLTVALCALAQCASGEAQEGLLTEDAAKKMKVSDLKRFLADRSASCDGCTEKTEFVQAALAARANPTVAAQPSPVAQEPIKADFAPDSMNMDEIMKRINGDGKKKERVKKILKKRGYDPR